VNRPVFGLDIDGTLLDYHGHFIAFARQYFGKEISSAYDARMPFHKHIGVSKVMYRQCKLAYRRGELKRSLPLLPVPYPNARTLTKTLRQWGCDVWLCTTRPYLSHDEVDSATRHNLRRNGVLYNGIIWGQHKYRELVSAVGKGRIVGVLDDVPDMCRQAERLGLRTAVAVRPFNEMQVHALGIEALGWSRAYNERDTVELFRYWLKEWREKQ
jgi:hypothetical protein